MIRERLAAGGAVAAAFIASLCCLGPLVTVGLGLGAFGVAVEPLRPYLTAASVVAIGYGFRRAYRRSSVTCVADGACASEPGSLATRMVLWCAAIVVLVVGVAPYAAGPLGAALSETKETGMPDVTAEGQSTAPAKTTIEVKGMTCSGCETTVRLALERMPGVNSAEVNFERGEAAVDYNPAYVTPTEMARELTRQTGYEAAPKEKR